MRITSLYRHLFAFLFSISTIQLSAQEDFLPNDYLGKEFYAGRRDAFRSAMPDSSVAVIFAYPTRTFSNDVEYIYHANPDMYYFSGYKEPHALLIIFKEAQTDTSGRSYMDRQTTWYGRRPGKTGHS